MAKVAGLIKSFNAGIFSVLMEGRTDIEKYPASLRSSVNFVPVPQGPLMRRSGTAMVTPVYDEAKQSALLPYIFSETQAQCLEFSEGKLRFLTEDGLLTTGATPVTATSSAGGFMQISDIPLVAIVGDQIVLEGFAFDKNLNGRTAKITAVVGTLFTLDLPALVSYGALTTATAAKVYTVTTPYAAVDVQNLRFVTDEDIVYLFCDKTAIGATYPTQKLQRNGALAWILAEVVWIDGPYDNVNDSATRITPSGTGNAIPVMTSNVLPSGVASDVAVSANAYLAFDGDKNTYWDSGANQTGWLQYQFGAGVIVDGYVIYMALANNDATYSDQDHAPGDFVFAGSNDGITFVTLDAQTGYNVYSNNRSLYFSVKNSVAYAYYRLTITSCTRNGAINPRIAGLVFTSRAAAQVTLTASAVTNINLGQGFLATDVGRLVRFQGAEGYWRALKINEVTSTTVVKASFQNDILFGTDDSAYWRLGLFSNTTGHPTCGTFFGDRLWVGGMFGYPVWFAASNVGKYEVMSPTDQSGTVISDNGMAAKLNARRNGRIAWISTDGRAVLFGTGSGEWSIGSSDPQKGIDATTAVAKRATVRGAAAVEPVQADQQILFVQKGYRTLREMVYSFQIDGYVTPSQSLYASHIGAKLLKQQEFAYEPHAINWTRLGDGKLAGFTYNKEEGENGWHLHDVGGTIESIAVLPSKTTSQDVLWMVVKRNINGYVRRYIEYMTPFWDFGNALDAAFFVDSGITYTGTSLSRVYGLWHLEGQQVAGLVQGSPIPLTTVVNGAIDLPEPSADGDTITIGKPYDSEAETSRLDSGAANGTAQGKWKRINKLRMRLWDSGGGSYNVRGADGALANGGEYIDLEDLSPETLLDTEIPLFTGDTKELDMPQAWSTEGTILLKQKGEFPLPFNVIALMPQLATQDGG